MKRLVLSFFVLLLALVSFGMPRALAAKKVVAVMPIENVSGYMEHRVAEIMGEQLTDALFRSGRVTVVERMQLANTLREIGFGMTGAVDQGAAAQAGRMMGAEYSLIGRVTMAGVRENPDARTLERVGGELFGRGGLGNIFGGGARSALGKYIGDVSVEIRIISNETGVINNVISASGSERANTPELAIHKACKEAAENFLKAMMPNAVGVIIDVEGDTVYIDAGSDQGVKKGDVFEIAKEGRPIQKPDGGMIMKYITIGKLKVIEVNADHSICKVTEHDGALSITNGAVVRRIKK